MRYIVLVLLACAAAVVSGRPPIVSEAGERPREDAEYETGDEAEDEDSLEDNESSFAEQESAEAENEQEEPVQHQSVQEPSENAYSVQAPDERASRDNSDNFPGYQNNKNDNSEEAIEEMNPNNEYETTAKPRDTRFNQQPDDQPNAMPHLNRDDNSYKQLSFNEKVNKRTPISRNNDEGDLLFENHQNQLERVEKNELNNNNELPETRENVRYSKKYYSLQEMSGPGEPRYETQFNVNRDRRATQETNDTAPQLTSNNNNVEVQDNNAEDEEAAIKRHVKKLSSEELQELLNSLSDDKKELLKKIMENDVDANNDISKREITKKAGAAPDETANLESGLFDASKLQEGSSSGDSNSQTSSTELTESSKQPNPQSDVSVLPVTKTLEASNGSSSSINNEKSDLTALSDEKSDISANTMAPVLDSNNEIKVDANIQEPKKTENKREINSDGLTNVDTSLDDTSLLTNNNNKDTQDLSMEPNYVCSQDEDLSQLIDNESQLNEENSNIIKRETYLGRDADFSDSIKSLEESFPNSNSYDEDDPYAGSDMAPLVRVKRKNSDLIIKKRAAGILPDAKVAYFPYRAENDDEDNDEGSEFDDEGFYDRTSNLAKPNAKDEESSLNLVVANQPLKEHRKDSESKVINRSRLTQTNNIDSDMSLGSDTDSVLSGVEGVDDNLMYSGSRNRRTAEDSENIEDQNVVDAKIASNRPERSTPLAGEDVKLATENYVGVPNYHENDAFGALPRNYEGELGRYKRIRRVKQPPQDVASSGT